MNFTMTGFWGRIRETVRWEDGVLTAEDVFLSVIQSRIARGDPPSVGPPLGPRYKPTLALWPQAWFTVEAMFDRVEGFSGDRPDFDNLPDDEPLPEGAIP